MCFSQYSPNKLVITGINQKTNTTFAADYDANKPMTARVFKTIADPFIGKFSFIKVCSGVLKSDDVIYNANKDTEEKLSRLYVLRGKEQIEVKELYAGDIGAIGKLSNTQTWGTAPPNIFSSKIYGFSKSVDGSNKICTSPNCPAPPDCFLCLHGVLKASPILLEPIVEIHVIIPDRFTGDIMGDLSRRRGRVLGMNPLHNGKQEIVAEMPLSETFGYCTELRSMTGGIGEYSYEFVRYDPAPADVQAKVIEENAAKVAQINQA